MPKRLLHFHHPVWVAIAVALALVAGLVSAARVWWPNVSQHGDTVAAWLSEELGNPVEIGSLAGSWNGTNPVLSLSQLKVRDRDGQVVIATLPEIVIELGWVELIKTRGFALQAMDISIERLGVLREQSGRIALDEFTLRSIDSDDRARSLPDIAKLRIRFGTVQYRDEQYPDMPPVEFNDVVVRFQKRAPGYALSFDVGPSEVAQSLQITAFLDEDVLHDRVNSGRIYASAEALSVQPWVAYLKSAGLAAREGLVDGQLWLNLKEGKIDQVSGELGTRQLMRATEESDVLAVLKPVASRFDWARQPDGWFLGLDGLALQQHHGIASPAGLVGVTVAYSDAQLRELEVVQLQASSVDMGALWEVLSLAPAVVTQVKEQVPATAIDGLVHDLKVHWHHVADSKDAFDLSVRLEGVSLQGDFQVSGLTGQLDATQDGGKLVLESPSLSLFPRKAFESALPDLNLNGVIAWSNENGQRRVQIPALNIASPHFSGQVRVRFDQSEAGSDVDAQMDFDSLPVAELGHYLPVRVMSPTLVKWLRRSLVKGVISGGSILLKGDPADYPFEHGGGLFQVLLDLDKVTLDYGEGWPVLHELDAGLQFTGKRMDLYARAGRIFDADVSGTTAEIDDILNDSVLKLHGRTAGSFTGGLKFLVNSPLVDRFGPYLDGTGASGQHRLAFRMDYPLYEGDLDLEGTLEFVDAGLALENFGVALKKTNGTLAIREDGVSGTGIQAELLGQPVELSVETREHATRAETVVKLAAHLSIRDLAGFIPQPMQNLVSGSTEWRAAVHLPDARQVATQPVVLEVRSKLVGIKSRAPYPLGKASKASWPMVLSGKFKSGRLNTGRMSLENRLHASVGFARDSQGHSVPARGEFRFGSGKATLPLQDKLRLTGQLDRLDIDAWTELQWSGREPERAQTSAGPDFPFDEIDLDVAQLRVVGHDFSAAQIDLEKLAATPDRGLSLAGLFQSGEAAGQVVISLSPDRNHPNKLDLEYLTLVSGDEVDHSSPRDFKGLRLQCERFSLDGLPLGVLTLETRPVPAGLMIETLSINAESFRIQGSGSWLQQVQGQRTELTLNLESDALGTTLERFDFQGNLEKAPATASVELNWSGSPSSVTAEKLNGGMDLHISEGRVLDIEPGVGRVFGLLSLGTLGRRLALDFSDLFQKGFSFDEITGSFRFEHGQAYTDNLVMEGPAARVELSGRTGLGSKDYDQLAVVMPKVSASIPVAGALAGGPVVGAALLVVQKLVGSEIDKVAEKRYRIKGTWAEPEITRFEAEVENEVEDTEEP